MRVAVGKTGVESASGYVSAGGVYETEVFHFSIQ